MHRSNLVTSRRIVDGLMSGWNAHRCRAPSQIWVSQNGHLPCMKKLSFWFCSCRRTSDAPRIIWERTYRDNELVYAKICVYSQYYHRFLPQMHFVYQGPLLGNANIAKECAFPLWKTAHNLRCEFSISYNCFKTGGSSPRQKPSNPGIVAWMDPRPSQPSR